MFDVLHNLILGVADWFHPDIGHGVFWGSLLVTFVASVMGKDQQQRLDQGKFGLAAGTSMGGLSGLLKNQSELVVVGFVGSAVGGLLGWLFYLILAYKVVRSPKLESLVIFQAAGLEGLQKQLDVKSKENLRAGFARWSEKFSRLISAQESTLISRVDGSHWEDEAISTIECWLTCAVDTLALVFGTLADKEQYQSRVTVIVYRIGQHNGVTNAVGKHWISYSGQLVPHSNILFDQTSIGYKVLQQQIPSPYFTTRDIAQKEGQPRADATTYRPFITFRLNQSAIISFDWPEQLSESDDYVESARSLFYSQITPAIAHVLDEWPRALADAAAVPATPTDGSGVTAHQVKPTAFS